MPAWLEDIIDWTKSKYLELAQEGDDSEEIIKGKVELLEEMIASVSALGLFKNTCIICDTLFLNDSGVYFCSDKCADEWRKENDGE